MAAVIILWRRWSRRGPSAMWVELEPIGASNEYGPLEMSKVGDTSPRLTEPFRRPELIDLSSGLLVKVLDAGNAERAQMGL